MSKDASTIALGIGDLSIDGQDVGYLGGSVTYTTAIESQDFRIGVPLRTVGRIITGFEATLKASLAQLDLGTLKRTLGVGSIHGNRLRFGTDWELPVLRNVCFVHTRDDGRTVTVFFPKAQIKPDSNELVFSSTEFTLQDVSITAIYDSSNSTYPLGYIEFS